MNDLEKLQQAIQELAPDDFAKFRAWFLDLELRREIAIGLEQAERGEFVDGEEAIREILEKL